MHYIVRKYWKINAVFVFLFCTQLVFADKNGTYISTEKSTGYFTLSAAGKPSPLCASSEDFPGVIKVVNDLQKDIQTVTGSKPDISLDKIPDSKEFVLAGTIGKNPLIDKLVHDKKINVDDIKGKWETYLIQVVEKPFPGTDRILLIAGSDKRGTIFGIYDLSSKIGVSPWYWWADVPAKKHLELYVIPGRFSDGEPKVKYRGIFINDEAPAFSGWSAEKYGTDLPNHKLYDHMFELILRLKGNYLWPAMWGRAFYDDDSLNPKLADEYGVVIGTSHHEPMMRAHVEWQRYGKGPWNYATNEATLKEFWRQGIKRMGNNESVVTLAMRGDGDEAMSPDANVGLLEKIVNDQREILKEVTGKDLESIPQVWALYKEVQEYYDKGMRVPDDVTVLLCDDNWGNIRKLPKLNEKQNKGGYGIYYHFDYVGGPRNYKWLNTNQIERVWEQMHLSYEYGVDRLWIVNVGDLKPMEFPIEFFLDYAWNPDKIAAESLPGYYQSWAAEQFGEKFSKDVADILAAYTKFNSRRKPELLSPGTYSLTNYREAESIVSDYKALEEKAHSIYNAIPAEYKDAFYELVLHPVEACANLNELYVTVAKNRLYAAQGRASANRLAEKSRELFKKDADITNFYNTILAKGKWDHMMDQTHIGYTNWQQPDKNIMPEVKEISIPEKAAMGITIEGSDKWWPEEKNEAVLPEFDQYNRQSYYIEIFNRGKAPFEFSAKTGESWVEVNKTKDNISTEERLWISINWEKAPEGKQRVPITITGPEGTNVIVYAVINNPVSPKREQVEGFVESNGYVSMEAGHYTDKIESSSISWLEIPNLGRTGSVITSMPLTADIQTPSGNTPRLEYKMFLFTSGEVKVDVYLSPTLKYDKKGLSYAISFDDELPQIINIHAGDNAPDWKYPQYWNQIVSNNIRIITSKHNLKEPGEHVLKFWMVDPGVPLQKIVVETGEVKPSYLGPPESFNNIKKSIGKL